MSKGEESKMLDTTERQVAAVAGSTPPHLRRRRNAVADIFQDLRTGEIEYLHNMPCKCSRLTRETSSGANEQSSAHSDCVLDDSTHDCDSESSAQQNLENDGVVSSPRYRVRRNGLANILDPNNTGRVFNISGNNHHCV